MSKAAAPCSSCPRPKNTKSSKRTKVLDFVLENVLSTRSDDVIKVKKLPKFFNYDLNTLNIIGELQTYVHKNNLAHIKMSVVYQDKKTKDVNNIEFKFFHIEKTRSKTEPGCCNCTYTGEYGCCEYPSCCTCDQGVLSSDTSSGGYKDLLYGIEKTIPYSVGDQFQLTDTIKHSNVYSIWEVKP